jgi:hypothetical protein
MFRPSVEILAARWFLYQKSIMFTLVERIPLFKLQTGVRYLWFWPLVTTITYILFVFLYCSLSVSVDILTITWRIEYNQLWEAGHWTMSNIIFIQLVTYLEKVIIIWVKSECYSLRVLKDYRSFIANRFVTKFKVKFITVIVTLSFIRC